VFLDTFTYRMTLYDKPIFLIGYRGTGKSAVARDLAEHLGYDSTDADEEIERRTGKSITEIFVGNGESAFRDLESHLVDELARLRRTVVALGGGAVLREANRTAIRAAGPVVWLTAPVDVIVQRLAADPATASRRPNLTNTGGREEIEAVLNERTPIYRECATLIVDTDGKTCAQVAHEIAANL
jgi:shikimate kinase